MRLPLKLSPEKVEFLCVGCPNRSRVSRSTKNVVLKQDEAGRYIAEAKVSCKKCQSSHKLSRFVSKADAEAMIKTGKVEMKGGCAPCALKGGSMHMEPMVEQAEQLKKEAEQNVHGLLLVTCPAGVEHVEKKMEKTRKKLEELKGGMCPYDSFPFGVLQDGGAAEEQYNQANLALKEVSKLLNKGSKKLASMKNKKLAASAGVAATVVAAGVAASKTKRGSKLLKDLGLKQKSLYDKIVERVYGKK